MVNAGFRWEKIRKFSAVSIHCGKRKGHASRVGGCYCSGQTVPETLACWLHGAPRTIVYAGLYHHPPHEFVWLRIPLATTNYYCYRFYFPENQDCITPWLLPVVVYPNSGIWQNPSDQFLFLTHSWGWWAATDLQISAVRGVSWYNDIQCVLYHMWIYIYIYIMYRYVYIHLFTHNTD